MGSALPGEPEDEGLDEEQDQDDDDEDKEVDDDDETDGGNVRRRRTKTTRPEMITVQLSAGVVVLRRLACGLLFVCVGPALGDGTHPQDQAQAGGATASSAAASTTRQASSFQQQQQQQQTDDLANELMHATLSTSQDPQPSSSSTSSPVSPTTVQHPAPSSLAASDSTPVNAQSGAAAPAAGAETASLAAVAAIRQQATELAAWLDDKLGGLSVPEEGVGVGL